MGTSPKSSAGSSGSNFDMFVGDGIDDAGLSLHQMRLLVHIARWQGKTWCDSTYSQISGKCGITRRKIKPSLDMLEGRGLIEIERRAGKDGRSRYRFTPHVAAVSAGTPPAETVVSQTHSGSVPNAQRQCPTGHTPLLSITNTIDSPDDVAGNDAGVDAPCTIRQARSAAEQAGHDPEIAETWWNDCDGRGWLDGRGHQIRKWRSAMQSYCRKWLANAQARPGTKPRSPKPKDYTIF